MPPLGSAVLRAYAGRWVACVGERVVGQGGTPEQAARAALFGRYKEKFTVMYVPERELSFPPLFTRVLQALPADAEVYLVGGAVRDLLLNRPLQDLDFVVRGDALKVARNLANTLGAAFYPLNVDFNVARVVFIYPEGQRDTLDFVGLHPDGLEADLRARDFTVNAMALDCRAPQALLDPLGGAADLRAQVLRACSETALHDDPVRILRAIRLAAALNLRIEKDTRAQMRAAAPELPRVSAERLRDELWRILDGPQPAAGIQALEMLGALVYILPETAALKDVPQSAPHVYGVWQHTLEVVRRLESLLGVLGAPYDTENGAGNLMLGLATLRLGRFRPQIIEFLQRELVPGRTLRPLLFFAALYHDIAKPQTAQFDAEVGRYRFLGHDEQGAVLTGTRAHALALSSDEVKLLRAIVEGHMRPLFFSNDTQSLTPRAKYRFFRKYGEAGVAIVLLSLADFWETYGATLNQADWTRHLDVARALLEVWWEPKDVQTHPPQLLSGHDLMQTFGLQPGRELGELLEALREAQALGEVVDREQAIAWVRSKLG